AILLLQLSAAGTGVPQRENVPGYLFVLSVPALAFALYLAYAAFFILHTVCLLCLTADVSIIAIFVLSGIATEVSITSFPGRVARDLKMLVTKPVALAALVLFVLAAASGLAYFPREGAAASAANLTASASSASTPTATDPGSASPQLPPANAAA